MPIAHGSSTHPIRVLITAATTLAARQLARDLAIDPTLQIITATSAAQLFDQVTLARPGVILLDTQLADTRTLQLMRTLTHQRNIAVVLRTEAGERSGMMLDALETGAIAVTSKPASIGETAQATRSLIWTLRAAASASIRNLLAQTEFAKVTGSSSSSILALGAGIGGLPALTGVLSQLPADAPGTIVITGLNGDLTPGWTDRMARRCDMRVKHAVNGDMIRPCQILVAPGDSHLVVRRTPGGLTVAVQDGPAVFHHKPSMELLLNSLADTAAPGTVAALFSGAGVDGVAGLLNLRKAGGRTIVESPQTCVCDDLTARAVRSGSADVTSPANEIAKKLMEFAASVQIPRAA